MPVLSRFFIRAGLVYFVGGFGLMTASQGFSADVWWLAFSIPAYFHMIMVGWISQIIIGVSYWMFPAINRDRPRGVEWMGWASFVFLNVGLMARVVAEPFSIGHAVPWAPELLTASALLQWLSGICYVVLIWPRVKGK